MNTKPIKYIPLTVEDDIQREIKLAKSKKKKSKQWVSKTYKNLYSR